MSEAKPERMALTAREKELLERLLQPELEYARAFGESRWALDLAFLMRKLGLREEVTS